VCVVVAVTHQEFHDHHAFDFGGGKPGEIDAALVEVEMDRILATVRAA
jgi:hypothetical protein